MKTELQKNKNTVEIGQIPFFGFLALRMLEISRERMSFVFSGRRQLVKMHTPYKSKQLSDLSKSRHDFRSSVCLNMTIVARS